MELEGSELEMLYRVELEDSGLEMLIQSDGESFADMLVLAGRTQIGRL